MNTFLEDGTIWLYLLLILLIFGSAFFSAAETAFSAINKIRLRNYAEEGNKKALRALDLAQDYDKTLSTILVGNNLVNIASTSIGTLLFIDLFGAAGVAISTVVMTIVILIFGEVMPKSIAKDHAENVALSFSGTLTLLSKLFFPITLLFKLLKKSLSKFTNKEGRETPSVTETELKYLIEDIEDQGVLEKEESELVQSALEFDEISVEEVLTPRVDITAIEVNDSIEKAKKLFFSTRYSRIPVYSETIDNIIGILNQQQFFTNIIQQKKFQLSDLVQPTLHVPPKKSIAALMVELQKEKTHMAIVTDQYGGTLGLITLEDILEELVGDIWDEHDEIIHLFKKLDTNTFEISGETNLYDLFEALDLEDKNLEDSINTVNGFVMQQLGKVAEVGDSFVFENLKFTVVQVDKKRMPTVHMEYLSL